MILTQISDRKKTLKKSYSHESLALCWLVNEKKINQKLVCIKSNRQKIKTTKRW